MWNKVWLQPLEDPMKMIRNSPNSSRTNTSIHNGIKSTDTEINIDLYMLNLLERM